MSFPASGRPFRTVFGKARFRPHIISNPPHVTDDSMAMLPEEFRHEPEAVPLAAGDDGNDILRRML